MGCKVREVMVDTGYDTQEIFKYLGKRGIKPVIKVRRLAVRRGGKRWKERNGYGRRWFWGHVSSVKFENVARELAFKDVMVSMFLGWVEFR